ncbi:MAG: hypothetical protein HC906_19960 [Bacteroidales bacterium]|nr:hypothetical protein [Bacteroidales bacterium]
MVKIVLILSIPLTLKSQKWERMPMVSKTLQDAGNMGGEGGQWPRGIYYSSDPDFLMIAIDVGGLYRSLDAGNTWQICMVGWNARGCNDIAIDPKNINHIIAIGGNSGGDYTGDDNGIYVSVNKAASWQQTLKTATPEGGKVAIDESSFDTVAGYCKFAYYSSPDNGFWKSTNGGYSWTKITADYSSCLVKVHPTKGYVYIGSPHEANHGFWKSTDGGTTFIRKYDNYLFGLDVISTHPDNVYISGHAKIAMSEDAGETFFYPGTDWAKDGLPADKPLENIRVSPANPDHMTVWYPGDNWAWKRWYSNNRGILWKECSFDNTNAFLPYNVRNGFFAWHPTDENIVFGIGGDWITKSTDAGKTFKWSGNGENAVMVGGGFNINPESPNTILLAFQDYNGAFTLDGGNTWNYRDISGKGWGGYCYGGYAIDSAIMWVGDAASWGGPRNLRISKNGGTTWVSTGNIFEGPDISYSSPLDNDVAFASNWRTDDKGDTWRKMDGCDGVFTSNPTGERELYGKKGDNIVVSYDKGLHWITLAKFLVAFQISPMIIYETVFLSRQVTG